MTGGFLFALLLLGQAPLLSVAVMPTLTTTTTGAQAASRVEAGIGRVVSQDARLQRVGNDVRDRLIASARGSGIDCDPRVASCAARIGAFGDVDRVLVSALTEEGTAPGRRARLVVSLVDCSDGRTLHTAAALLGATSDTWPAGIEALARATTTHDRVSGELRVTSNAPGTVVVDGVVRGPAPVALLIDAGPHKVTLRRADGSEEHGTVEVPAAAPATLDLSSADGTQTDAGSALQPVGLGVAAAGAGLAVALGAGAALVAPDEAERAQRTARSYNDAVLLGRALLIGSAASAVGAAAGAALWLASASE